MRASAAVLSLLITLTLSADTRVTNAVVFKNGLAFMTREGSVPFSGGVARVWPVPDALLGTLWIGASGRTIDEVRAVKESHAGETVDSISDLIDANVGRAAVVTVGNRDYSGTLVRSTSPLLMINVDGKVHAFDRSKVESIAFAQSPVTEPEVPTPVLLIAGRGSDANVPLTLSYLRNGISWMPEYSIAIGDDGRAQMSMQATLINDGEELRDARVRFAVGFPSFEFSNVPSPMTMQQTLLEFLSLLGRSDSADVFSNAAVQQNVVFTNVGGRASDVDVDAIARRLEGEASEDLFFYDRPNVTLAKGERGLYPVFNQSVPFRHVYLWEVPQETEETRSRIEKPADRVWHSIVLTNSGATPWTTAPAFVLAHGKPLAQSTLGYTAIGSHGTVKLTVATDVGVERQELEVERKPRDLERFGYHYDAVTIEGTLVVHNFKREAITLSIDKSVEGTTISHQPKAKVTRRALRPKAINPTERLEWEVPLAAGEEKTVKYRYKVWVRE
jgi:hypothetical protein